MVKKQDTTLPVLTHILGLLTGFLGPLIILLAVEDKNAKDHSKYALNWQFSLMIYMLASAILSLILIGFLFIFALIVLDIILPIMAAVKAGDNKLWQYPLAIRFFKV